MPAFERAADAPLAVDDDGGSTPNTPWAGLQAKCCWEDEVISPASVVRSGDATRGSRARSV